jgi:PAS domain-containing protein
MAPVPGVDNLKLEFTDLIIIPASAGFVKTFGPLDDEGAPIPLEELPLTTALREGRPAHAEFCVRAADGEIHRIAASAMPIIGHAAGASGAMVIFWPVDEARARAVTTGRHEVVK